MNHFHDQFKIFKVARENDISQPTVPTLQIDWPEKAKMGQAREKKSTYYDECCVSFYPMHDCTTDGRKSDAGLRDYTDPKAAAVMTSILPVLKNFLEGGKTTIATVSDSPTSQYRNRKIFYLIIGFLRSTTPTFFFFFNIFKKTKVTDKLDWIFVNGMH